VALRMVPCRHLAQLIGRTDGAPATAQDTATAHAVRRAVCVAAKRYPETCFARALAGRVMLRRRGLGSSLHFGVCAGEDGALKFHAWLCHGDVVVTGREGHRRYTVLTTFHDARGAAPTRAAVPA